MLALIFAAAIAQAAPDSADVVIRDGTVVDGTLAAPRRADVVVRGDRVVIVAPGGARGVPARRVIEARGLVVAPGFIDPHTHTLGDLSGAGRADLPYLMQGVTTVVTGNDGGGPLRTGAVLARWDSAGIGTNAALYVGHGTVRGAVLGMSDAAPTPTQLDSMRALVAAAMREGALGLSTGLYYAPGSYATTDEVVALARVAAAAGGIYDSHLRDESSYTIGLLGAVREALRIGREAGIPVHISHIKALGVDVWGESDSVIALVDEARAAGLQVTADQYPYTASGTSVAAALLPRWAEAGGRDSLRARTADPAVHARLVAEMEENLRRRGGDSTLLITSGRHAGKTLAQLAAAEHRSPIDAALGVIAEGDAAVASFNMSERDIERFLVQPWVMTGSDGSTGHPRKYGTFPRLFRMYVRERRLLTLAQAVHRSSALTAETLHLAGRGTLTPGSFADVVVFDPRTFTDRATYEQPKELATGVRWVLVNGVVAVADGKYTGALAGRALRRATTAPATGRD